MPNKGLNKFYCRLEYCVTSSFHSCDLSLWPFVSQLCRRNVVSLTFSCDLSFHVVSQKCRVAVCCVVLLHIVVVVVSFGVLPCRFASKCVAMSCRFRIAKINIFLFLHCEHNLLHKSGTTTTFLRHHCERCVRHGLSRIPLILFPSGRVFYHRKKIVQKKLWQKSFLYQKKVDWYINLDASVALNPIVPFSPLYTVFERIFGCNYNWDFPTLTRHSAWVFGQNFLRFSSQDMVMNRLLSLCLRKNALQDAIRAKVPTLL